MHKPLEHYSLAMKTNHSRAKAGGEYGANGEWYEGGKFINTVAENAKRAAKDAKASSRKQNINAGVWEVAPVAGKLALFPMLSGMEIPNRDRSNWQFTFNPDLCGAIATVEFIAIRKARIAAFNAGERWV